MSSPMLQKPRAYKNVNTSETRDYHDDVASTPGGSTPIPYNADGIKNITVALHGVTMDSSLIAKMCLDRHFE